MLKSITLKDSFKDYKKEGGDLEYKVYRNICEEYNEEVISNIILDTLEFKIPNRLGSIRIKKVKGSPKRVDWALTKKMLYLQTNLYILLQLLEKLKEEWQIF